MVHMFTVLREPASHIRSAWGFWLKGHKGVPFSYERAHEGFMDNLQSQFLLTSYRGPKREHHSNTIRKKVTQLDMPRIRQAIDSLLDDVCDMKAIDACLHRLTDKVNRYCERLAPQNCSTIDFAPEEHTPHKNVRNPVEYSDPDDHTPHQGNALDVDLFQWAMFRSRNVRNSLT